MKRISQYVESNPHVAISFTAILCSIQFLMSFFGAIRTGNFDSDTMSQMLSTADGFESVVLFTVMVVLKGKKK